MDELICEQCGMPYGSDDGSCPRCGTANPHAPVPDDPVIQLTRNLLQQARDHQQQGDLVSAIQCATDAVSLKPNCSAAHTMLGSLYEQQGEKGAARLHFQRALTVAQGEEEDCLLPPIAALQEATTARPSSGWMLAVLIGCIVFSGLAALFTLFPNNFSLQRGSLVIKVTNLQKVPAPKVDLTDKQPDTTATQPETGTAGTGNDDTHAASDNPPKTTLNSGAVKPEPAPIEPRPSGVQSAVLGPSATTGAPAMPVSPSEAQADQAFFCADYEKAAAMYEKVLDETPSPRDHKQLALCYQRLGNSEKAEYHLQQALEGYKAAYSKDPQNTSVEQELKSCQTTLDTLRASRE